MAQREKLNSCRRLRPPASDRGTTPVPARAAIWAILLSVSILTSCADDRVLRKRLFFRMDTVTEITISAPKSFDARPVWKSVDSLLSAAEKRFSATGEFSEVKILNERGTADALPVSPELCGMLKTGVAYGDTLDGAFDVTVLPLKELWGFCESCGGGEPPPDSTRIGAALRRVDYRRVRVGGDCDSVFLGSPDVRIDVGGIAKGYVLAWTGALLKDRGVDDFLIAAGGDILASGRKGGDTPWRAGVRHPRANSELITTTAVENAALVTSGDYERFRIVDGGRYHHIFNTATGYPCADNQSVTIRAGDPVRADILSTGLFCRSAEKILAFVNARDDVECFVVDSDGNTSVSNGW